MPSLTYEQLSLIFNENKDVVLGGMIQKIHQPQKEFLLLQIRKPQINYRLFFCFEQQSIAFYLTNKTWKNPSSPLFFCQLLRKYLLNGRITEFTLAKSDRSLLMKIQTNKENIQTNFLLSEMWGRSGNTYLLDSNKNIIGSLHPSKKPKDYFAIVTPSVSTNVTPKKNFLEEHITKDPGSFPWNEAADNFFSTNLLQERENRQLRVLSSIINKEQKKLRNKISKLQTHLSEAKSSEDLRIQGELLKSNMHLAKRGTKQIKVINYFSENANEYIEIPLDSRKDAKENMQHYFKRYRKLQDGIPFLHKQIDKAQQEIDNNEKHLECLKNGNFPPLSNLPLKWQRQLQQLSKGTSTKSVPQKQRDCYYKFTSQDNITILVGRGSRDNDQLTFQVAKGNDLWMHAENYPGAHVVILNRDKNSPPQRTLFDAAQLTAYYSKAKNHPKVSISYTYRKNVSKPKKSKPGLVYLSSKKNLIVAPDKEILEKLLPTKE
ncbi:NFACT family protein [Candidatus Uabimicrobium sp. HlEnr_7]|uniref:Rqc2 family fibronectin-binding protein n=1 Tax=Candidatus Uabimicrobium helgolandensis TaxID=3095367 RepID=UPI0035564EF3